jgi:predicted metal-binding membrane protein
VLTAILAVTALAWAYILEMTHQPAHGMRHLGGIVLSCCGVDFWVTFLMWSVMMVGMMVPSAAPMLLAFATMNRRRVERGAPYVPTVLFLAGYLIVWTAFSALAALAQWALFRATLLNPHSQRVGPWLAGALLVVAGVFQLSPTKNACLSHCRSPLGFFMTEWRDGAWGALRMGVRHGAFCTGCCWMLMALLFVAGVMNLTWVAAISAYVLAEKVLPGARLVSLVGAIACFAFAAALIGHALVA